MPERSQELLALHEASDLVNIEFEKLHCERTGHRSPDEKKTPIDVDPNYSLDVEARDDGNGFRVKLGIDTDLGVGEVDTIVVAYYNCEGYKDELTVPLMVEYANEVAVMALLPYLRHAIADLTQRVFGPPLVMPTVRRGELTFSVSAENEAEISSGE